LERPPGNWRGRARSEDFRRSKSRDTPSPRRCSPRRCSPRRGSPRRRTPERHKRDRYDRRMPEDRHRFDDRRGFSRDRDLGYGRPRSPLRRRPRSDSPRRFRQRQRDARDVRDPPSDKPRRFGMKVMEEDRHVAARNPPLIISCSRRTDVPWGFLRQYLNGFEDGFMYIASGPRKNPVVRALCVQPYNPQMGKGVMCISWWSKNYKKWIQAWQKPDSVLHRYPVHLFNYTVNSENLALEPGVDTSLTERLGQLTFLVQTFGAHAVSPRFDPIVHYRNLVGGPIMDNMKDFETIVRHVGSLGVDHIVFSFCQAYPKSVRNMRLSGMELVTLNRAEQCAVLDKLMPIAHRYGVQMRCCGDKGIVGYPITKSETEGLVAAAQREEQKMQGANFPVIGQSRCVDARLADRIAREKGLNVFMSLAKDLRQRKDCECTRSTDIGQYTLQCPHGCAGGVSSTAAATANDSAYASTAVRTHRLHATTLHALYACSGGSRHANAHADAPTARAPWCRHGWWATAPTATTARSQCLRNDDECLQAQLASGVDDLCFSRSRRGARKNGRVPNETMTCHGWDGNPSLLQVLGLAFRPPVFFPRGMFLGCFKMFPGQPMQGRFHLAPMTGFKPSSFGGLVVCCSLHTLD